MVDTLTKLNDGFQTAFINYEHSSEIEYRPQFISNDHTQGKKVLASIEDELKKCSSFLISVAFITDGGIAPLLQVLRELEAKGVPGKILTTDYLNFSSPIALEKLDQLSNVDLRVYRTDGREGFHTKGYIFKGDELYKIITGSSNMTQYALTMNKEWNAGLRFVDVGNNAAKMTALLGEQTDVINISYSLANDYFETGEFIPLVLLGSEKNDLLPIETPIASELGLTDVDFSKFFWVGTGPEVPDEKVAALTDVLKKVTEDTDFISSIESNYLTVRFMGGKDAQDFCNKMYEETLLPYKDDFLAAQ